MDGWVRVARGLFRLACKQSGWQIFRAADGFSLFLEGSPIWIEEQKRGEGEREGEWRQKEMEKAHSIHSLASWY